MQHGISYEHCGVYRCHAQPLNLRASAVFVLINYNRELKLSVPLRFLAMLNISVTRNLVVLHYSANDKH